MLGRNRLASHLDQLANLPKHVAREDHLAVDPRHNLGAFNRNGRHARAGR
jgi:hypothetical protein